MPTPPKATIITRPKIAVAKKPEPVALPAVVEASTPEEPKRIFVMVEEPDHPESTVSETPVEVEEQPETEIELVAEPVPVEVMDMPEPVAVKVTSKPEPVAVEVSSMPEPVEEGRRLSKLMQRMSGRSPSSSPKLTTTNPMFLPTAPTTRPVITDDDEDESDSAMIKQLALEMMS
jgi:hypothetical protein